MLQLQNFKTKESIKRITDWIKITKRKRLVQQL